MKTIAVCYLCIAPIFLVTEQAYSEEVESSSDQNHEIVVVGERLKKSHVRFSIDRTSRAVRCKAVKANTDPTYVNLKCEVVRRCAKVEPYSRSNVRNCLEQTRSQVAEEYVKSHRN